MQLKLSKNIFLTVSSLMILFLLTNTSYVQADENNEGIEDIQKTLNIYFSGRANADLDLLQQAFSSKAGLETVNAEGEIQTISFDEYLQVVKKSGPVKVKTSIVDISIMQSIAVAQTRFDYGQRVYYDYLTLLKTNNGWKITNKAFIKELPTDGTDPENK